MSSPPKKQTCLSPAKQQMSSPLTKHTCLSPAKDLDDSPVFSINLSQSTEQRLGSEFSESQSTETTCDHATDEAKVEVIASKPTVASADDIEVVSSDENDEVQEDAASESNENAPSLCVGKNISISPNLDVSGIPDGCSYYVRLSDSTQEEDSHKVSNFFGFAHIKNTFVGPQSIMRFYKKKSDATYTILFFIRDANNQMYLAFTADSLSGSNGDIRVEYDLVSRVIGNVKVHFGDLMYETEAEFEQLVRNAYDFAILGVSRKSIWYVDS